MKDTYRHKGLRKKLVASLREKAAIDEAVLQAMETLPRHFFLDKAFEEWAYEDKPFPIGSDQTISQPLTVAIQTTLLDIKPREKVLEIGTGSGYQAAILGLLGARVYTLERHEILHLRAQQLLNDLQLGNIRCFYRDGFKGLPEFGPYDKIIVTAGAPEVPKVLLKQLQIGGKMVIPVGVKTQHMLVITRMSEDKFETENKGDFRFVPFLKGLR
ncbi:MAG: protein-L-isoaspartate(D-aspartate) O-methyltransferase [Saprospiraceae bacterium]